MLPPIWAAILSWNWGFWVSASTGKKKKKILIQRQQQQQQIKKKKVSGSSGWRYITKDHCTVKLPAVLDCLQMCFLPLAANLGTDAASDLILKPGWDVAGRHHTWVFTSSPTVPHSRRAGRAGKGCFSMSAAEAGA